MATRIVVDTSILIDLERGIRPAIAYVGGLVGGTVARIHPVTVAELLFGARNKLHLQAVRGMLRPLPVLTIKNTDFLHATDMLDQLTLATKVGWPDCFIAATCLRLNMPLATLNDRHFTWIPGLKVIRPY